MKKGFLLALSLSALLATISVNGCKDTTADPAFVQLAEIRFANFHQIDGIQIYMYPVNATSADSAAASKTPTPLTYGIVTPYYTNIPTNRNSGATYHLVVINAVTKNAEIHEDIILKPGDKKTWFVTGNGVAKGGAFESLIVDDAPLANAPSAKGFFRFINVNPSGPMTLRVGDPINGMPIAVNQAYKTISQYVGIPTAPDTTLTFYVTDANNKVVGRLSGITVDSAAYKTVTWGGQDSSNRTPDASGAITLNDTTRIRILDDDQGVDLTYAVPSTLRYNFINALVPPANPTSTLFDYMPQGLSVVINNNSDFNYQNLTYFSLAPHSIGMSPDGKAFYQVPTAFSYNPATDKLYLKLLKTPAGEKNPSSADNILFRFYAGLTGANGQLKSDQLYTIIVFDSVKKPVSLPTAGYDSAAGVATIPIPDAPIAGSARIVVGNMLCYLKNPQTPNKIKFSLMSGNGTETTYKVGAPKTYDATPVVPIGTDVTLSAQTNNGVDPTSTITYTFTPEDGAIYEAFLVGRQNHPNPDYQPKWIVVRVNPIHGN